MFETTLGQSPELGSQRKGDNHCSRMQVHRFVCLAGYVVASPAASQRLNLVQMVGSMDFHMSLILTIGWHCSR